MALLSPVLCSKLNCQQVRTPIGLLYGQLSKNYLAIRLAYEFVTYLVSPTSPRNIDIFCFQPTVNSFTFSAEFGLDSKMFAGMLC